MLRLTNLKLPLDHTPEQLETGVCLHAGLKQDELKSFMVFKRGVDARKKSAIVFIYTIDFAVNDEAACLKKAQIKKLFVSPTPDTDYKFVAQFGEEVTDSEINKFPAQVPFSPRAVDLASSHAERAEKTPHVANLPAVHNSARGKSASGISPRPKLRPVVIGTGPCGLFAALILAQMGLRPIIFERGKAVRERTQDTWGFWRKRELMPESNVQFGEGGAGTFSDGKLYSQVKDPKHYGRKVLTEFVKAGAPPEIMYVSKPHIGTFRLVKMVQHMRATIENLGGEFRFQTKLENLQIENGKVRALDILNLKTEQKETLEAEHVVLAIGHSARDTFEMLVKVGVYVEPKAFSIGFRIEHPQSLIDRARLGPFAGNELLGAADYKLVHHASTGRAVYSFCMCPGGTVVAAASEPNRVVTNGMSQYSRNERNANAAIVVSIDPTDYPPRFAGDVLAGMAFQRHWESRAFEVGGGTYSAPGQLVGDFLAGVASTEFGSVLPSYKPAVHLTDLSLCVPDYVTASIREALPAFDKEIAGFALHDAILTGVETRTSSPIRIKRDEHTLQSLNTQGLYPAGEGAGYAGGILSAAIDGIKTAEALAQTLIKLEN